MNWLCAECSGEGPWRTQRAQSCCCPQPSHQCFPASLQSVPDLLSALSRMICPTDLRKLCSLRFPQCLGHHHHIVYMIGFYMNRYKYFSCYWSTCSHTQTHIHTYIGRIQFLTTIGLKINQFILTSKFLINFSMEVDRTVPVLVLLLNLVIIAKGNHCAFYFSCCWIAILAHKNGNGKFKGQF